ncbi:hypothetical protein JY651_07975 [Pyxidicoccus parkwayensis]|uniref:DUF2750 domain-containing protein n=1 Tax=Pyxidicoccus parkwayensis TaxID=2813578 RepID=A0ABX7P347_9BACT|nr:hypothetical protein [Pyxidicoccus parkwaysis]QSQ24867.1 hypothetical protein JY651_07975 [Pyxidicoccus parkwaysis]
MTASSPPPSAELLRTLLAQELSSISLTNWGYFYPAQVAVWRFIQAARPGVLDEPLSGFDTEPWWDGKGARWYLDVLWNNEAVLTPVEEVLYPLVKAVPRRAVERGFLYPHEVPSMPLEPFERLVPAVLTEIDRAVREGLVE